MYLWVETKSENNNNNNSHTYTYDLEWRSDFVDSGSFKHRGGHEND